MSADYPAKLYVAVHDGNPGDVDFYRRRCADADSVLELGCGDARVLAALARPARSLVGVDLEPELLELARARRADMGELGETLELVASDMAAAELDLGRRFERVIIPYGGLYCLLDDAAFDGLMAVVERHLAPGGRFIFDCWSADGFHAEADPEDMDPGWIERVKAVEVEGETWEVLERSAWQPEQRRIDVTYIHVPVGLDPEAAVEGVVRQRYWLAPELEARLSGVGLRVEAMWGDFEGSAHGPDSSLMIVECTRAAKGPTGSAR